MAQVQPSSLLLLSPPPWPPSFESSNAAYGKALSSVLSQVAKLPNEGSKAAVLQIAVPCPHLCGPNSSPRHRVYDQTQQLLAALYSIISIVYTRESIDVEDQGGVNSVILLLSYNSAHPGMQGHQAPGDCIQQGPVVNLETLAACGRPWTHIFSPASEDGEKVLQDYISLRQAVSGHDQLHTEFIKVNDVNKTPILSQDHGNDQQLQRGSRKHTAVAVGGTFDHLHAGHKLLLTMTALMIEPFEREKPTLDRSITVGITGDELLKNKNFAEYLESWEDRQAYVTDFLKTILDFSPSWETQAEVKRMSDPGPNGKAVHTVLKPKLTIKCVEISDPFGPTITDETISALIVSAETRSGGEAVNTKRQEKGWQTLEVYEVAVLDAKEELRGQTSTPTNVQQSFESKISSTAIRQRKYEKAHSTQRRQ